MSDVSRPRDYERTDADPRLVGALALGLAVFLVITPLLLKVLYPGASNLGVIPSSLPKPPSPRLQVDPVTDLNALRATEHQQLDSYGWINRESRVAHIPIDRAMELTGERGLPGWPQTSSQPSPQAAPR